MTVPTSYTEWTLAHYMVQTLGDLAGTLNVTEETMFEAINDVALACGVADIAEATDVAKVRALAKVAALRHAQTVAAGWYDFTADGGSYKRSQVMAQLEKLLASAENAAMPYDGLYAVGFGVMTFANDPYVFGDDTEAQGVG